MGQRHRAVAALHAPAAGPGGAESGGDGSVGSQLHQGVGRGRVVGKAAGTQHHARPELWKAGPSTWARQAARTGLRGSPGDGSAAPSMPNALQAASTMDCQPVHRHRWARKADSMSRRVGDAPGAAASSAASRSTMPGVQKPH